MRQPAKPKQPKPKKTVEEKRSKLEQSFVTRWIQLAPDSPPFVEQFIFAANRGWAFDFSWPDWKIAVEMEGGTWNNGAHVRGKGYAEDCEKYNAAALAGWTLLRYTTDMLENDPTKMIYEIKQAISNGIIKADAERFMLDEIARLQDAVYGMGEF